MLKVKDNHAVYIEIKVSKVRGYEAIARGVNNGRQWRHISPGKGTGIRPKQYGAAS